MSSLRFTLGYKALTVECFICFIYFNSGNYECFINLSAPCIHYLHTVAFNEAPGVLYLQYGVQYGALFLHNCRMNTVASSCMLHWSYSLYSVAVNIALVSFPEKVYHQRPAVPYCNSLCVSSWRCTLVSSRPNAALYCSCPFDVWVCGDWELFQIALRWMSVTLQRVRAFPRHALAEQNRRAEEEGGGDLKLVRWPPDGFPSFHLSLHPHFSIWISFFYPAHLFI